MFCPFWLTLLGSIFTNKIQKAIEKLNIEWIGNFWICKQH